MHTAASASNSNTNINDEVELKLHVSCSVFWKYELKHRVNRNEYANNPFSILERDLCDAMIQHIHQDLALNNDENMIQQLCEISSKFHIHGHTTESLLFHQTNAPHADHGGIIYLCTHC